MSGGISFSIDKNWLVASWVFRHTIDKIQKHVSKESFPELYSLVTDEENHYNFIFLEKLSTEEKQEFYSALKSAYNEVINEDGRGFESREWYLAYLKLLNELKDLVSEEIEIEESN